MDYTEESAQRIEQDKFRLAAAVKYLAATPDGDGYRYFAHETHSHWWVSEADLLALGEALEHKTADTYGLWCSDPNRDSYELAGEGSGQLAKDKTS
jgi:hypothetical protein